MSIDTLTHDDSFDLNVIEELEQKSAPDGGETVLPLVRNILPKH